MCTNLFSICFLIQKQCRDGRCWSWWDRQRILQWIANGMLDWRKRHGRVFKTSSSTTILTEVARPSAFSSFTSGLSSVLTSSSSSSSSSSSPPGNRWSVAWKVCTKRIMHNKKHFTPTATNSSSASRMETMAVNVKTRDSSRAGVAPVWASLDFTPEKASKL